MSAAIALWASTGANAQLVVDCHGDSPHPEAVYLEQLGQKLTTEGDPAPQITAYTQGVLPEVYALKDSRIAWVFPLSDVDPVTGTMDLGKVWCEPTGENARLRTATGKGAVDTRYNFMDGRLPDPIYNVAGFTQMHYEEVWDNIDIVLSSNGSGPVMYFVIRPGGNPDDIHLQFHGQDSLKFVEGEMTIYKQNKWIRLREATAYQVDDQDQVTDILNWTADWYENQNGGIATLTFDTYDTTQTLIFKIGYPQLPPPPPPTDEPEWSTYLSSPSLFSWVTGTHATEDGGLYVCGHAGINDFPASPFQGSVLPSQNGFWAYFDDEHSKDLAFFFGPSARCITVDESGEDPLIYVAGGRATNDNLYTLERDVNDPSDYFHPATAGAFDRSWVACFSYGGSGANDVALLWSTHFRADEVASMVVRGNGDLYLTGIAYAALETVSGGWVQSLNYDESAFVARFSPNSELLWCTPIGGANKDWGLDIALHEGVDRLAVVGQTKSNAFADPDCQLVDPFPFPIYDGGHWFYCACGGNSSCQIGQDGFIALFDLDGTRQTISYFGGRGSTASSVDFDPAGALYVAGHVNMNNYTNGSCTPPSSTNMGFPHCTAPGWFDVPSSSAAGAHYLARFSPDLDLQWSTVLNETGDFLGISEPSYPQIGKGLNLPQVDVDEAGAVYFAGSTLSGSGTNTQAPFPLQEEPGLYFTEVNNDAGWQNPAPDYNSGQDIYVIKLSPQGTPVWGTLYGGTGTHVQPEWYQGGGDLLCALQVRYDRVYIGGCTNSWFNMPNNHTPPAYFNNSPPDPLVEDGPNVWHGFLANLSDLLNYDVGIEALTEHISEIRPYPSPTERWLTIPVDHGEPGDFRLSLFDATGRVVLVKSFPGSLAHSAVVDVSNLAPGAYSGLLSGARSGRFSIVKQ